MSVWVALFLYSLVTLVTAEIVSGKRTQSAEDISAFWTSERLSKYVQKLEEKVKL
jgi:hypothetical protein